MSTGIISGPVLGGLIIDAVDWRWIFYVNLPIGIIGILAALKYIPHTKPGGGEKFDFIGGATFFVGLLTLLLGLTLGQDRGFTDPLVVAMYLVAGFSLFLFVAIENRVRHPMLDLAMFRSRDFSMSLFARYATFTAMSGVSLLLPFYLTDVLELTPRGVGFAMAALPVTMGIVAPLAGSWSDRNGVRRVAMGGLFLLAIAYSAARIVLGADTPIFAFVFVAFLLGLGFGSFQSPNNSAVMGAVPDDRLGVASEPDHHHTHHGLDHRNRSHGNDLGCTDLGVRRRWACAGRPSCGSSLRTPGRAPGMSRHRGYRRVHLVARVEAGLGRECGRRPPRPALSPPTAREPRRT